MLSGPYRPYSSDHLLSGSKNVNFSIIPFPFMSTVNMMQHYKGVLFTHGRLSRAMHTFRVREQLFPAFIISKDPVSCSRQATTGSYSERHEHNP
jgi:hypothetical protein